MSGREIRNADTQLLSLQRTRAFLRATLRTLQEHYLGPYEAPMDDQVERFSHVPETMLPTVNGDWVRYSDYEKLEAERDQWKQAAERSTDLADEAANLGVKRTVKRVHARRIRSEVPDER
jgi:hypothetical protein